LRHKLRNGALFCISPLDLLVEGEPVITKLARKRKRMGDVIDLFQDD